MHWFMSVAIQDWFNQDLSYVVVETWPYLKIGSILTNDKKQSVVIFVLFTMPSCPNCKRTFKNMSNHVAQGLCPSRCCSTVVEVEWSIVDNSRSNPVDENNALNMSLLLNNGNVLLNWDNTLMSCCSVSVGNDCHNVDSHDNSSVSVCNNNDVNLLWKICVWQNFFCWSW